MKTFLIADPHFSHEGMTKFTREDGTKLRPFNDAAEMDKELVSRWNSVVGKDDKVYVLGDVAMRKKHLPILLELNGKKVLIRGNHDIESAKEYLKYFYDVRAFHYLDKFALTHFPIHPDSLGRYLANIHGHIHYRKVLLNGEEDKRYYCVSAEHLDYTPVEWNVLRGELYKRLGVEIQK